MHLYTHVVDHADDVFDLLRIDDVIRQMIVDLGIGQESLLLTFCDQQFELRLLVLVHHLNVSP